MRVSVFNGEEWVEIPPFAQAAELALVVASSEHPPGWNVIGADQREFDRIAAALSELSPGQLKTVATAAHILEYTAEKLAAEKHHAEMGAGLAEILAERRAKGLDQ